MGQIGGWLDPDDQVAFQNYAASLHLSATSLAKLLIRRELKLHRLEQLKALDDPGGSSVSRKRVTAHFKDSRTKQAFGGRADGAGLAPDVAASILFRAEIRERSLYATVAEWLESP